MAKRFIRMKKKVEIYFNKRIYRISGAALISSSSFFLSLSLSRSLSHPS